MMKRFIFLLLMVLLLAGCANEDISPTVVPTEALVVTEPAEPWVERVGMDWDKEGILQEIPLTVPDGLHYTAMMEFNGDLLLWSMDNHRTDVQYAELCLIELDDGSVIAQRDVQVSGYVYPSCTGRNIYLCDTNGGMIYQLDKSLQTVSTWSMQPTDGSIYVSATGSLYLLDYESHLMYYDLDTGNTFPVLAGNPDISWVDNHENTLIVKYYDPDLGSPKYAVVDLVGGEYFVAPLDEAVDNVTRTGNTWLYEKYLDQYVYYLQTDGTEPLRVSTGYNALSILKEGYLLANALDGTTLNLYRMDGSFVSGCTVFENQNGYVASDFIWNESLGGYFFVARSYDENSRLLFWDIAQQTEGQNLPFEPMPQPDEVQSMLEQRAEALGRKYGVTILVGDDCDTQFDEFSATLICDLDRVNAALDTLDEALGGYPEGFIRQLRYGYIKGIQIQLVSDLQADGSGRTGGGYNAFTQPQFDYYLMVMDIDDCFVETYYHEFSHIIDSYLDWDAQEREGALYSEEEWNSLNPRWFDGYTYDYSQMQSLEQDGAFIRSYATISPTEDRATVMEYAMVSWGKWSFEDAKVLQKKLDYYCRCIRDAFDTAGWPETTLWEQYLK